MCIINYIFNFFNYFNYRNLILTIPITIFAAVVGALYSNIAQIISFLGGCCSSVLMFLIPALLFYKISLNGLKDPKTFLTVFILSLLTIIGYIAGLFTLMSIFRGEGSE